MTPAIERIISGGQTGADRAALDFAIEHGIPHGGWCPKGRKAEDDPIPERYQLQEHASGQYLKRTEQNVIDGRWDGHHHDSARAHRRIEENGRVRTEASETVAAHS